MNYYLINYSVSHNMIKNIIDLLNSSDWYVGDEDIDFAMGANNLPSTYKQAKQLIKRRGYGNRSK